MQCTFIFSTPYSTVLTIDPLNAELNPICHLLAFLGAHHIFHVSRIRVNVSTYALSIKKIVQLINPSLYKNDVNYRCVCCSELRWGGGQLLVCFASAFIHVCGILYGTLYIMHEEVLKSEVTR
jgi:hypothetical protein